MRENVTAFAKPESFVFNSVKVLMTDITFTVSFDGLHRDLYFI
jgi:hypothetical protein